jgi:hypothetical protein
MDHPTAQIAGRQSPHFCRDETALRMGYTQWVGLREFEKLEGGQLPRKIQNLITEREMTAGIYFAGKVGFALCLPLCFPPKKQNSIVPA